MSKMKLSDLVANRLEQKEDTAPVEKPEIKIPAVDAVKGVNTAVQRTMKYKEIDPSKCRPWKHHNRPDVWLTPESCKSLIASIKAEGQLELGLVRAVNDEPGIDYEIIYGARRWFSAKQIDGGKFKARITDASDQECALLMHVENEESENISEFEKALSYDELVSSGVFTSQKQLADNLRVSKAYISKLLKAAKLFHRPELRELLKPFSRELSLKNAADIVQLLEDKKTSGRVVAKALELGVEEGGRLPRLLGELKAVAAAEPKSKNREKCYFKKGSKKLLHSEARGNGKFVLTLEPGFLATAGDEAESLLMSAIKEAMMARDKS